MLRLVRLFFISTSQTWALYHRPVTKAALRCVRQLSVTKAQSPTAFSSLPNLLPDLILSSDKRHLPLIRQIVDVSSAKGIKQDLLSVLQGVKVLKETLGKGYLPQEDVIWPAEPFRTPLFETMYSLSMPYMCGLHSELVPFVITSILQSILKYLEKVNPSSPSHASNEDDTCDNPNNAGDPSQANNGKSSQNNKKNNQDSSPQEKMSQEQYEQLCKDAATSISKDFQKKWAPTMKGLKTLDETYGTDHKLPSLLSGAQEGNDSANSEDSAGIGIFDGLWTHTGWKEMNSLQQRLKNMKELRDLIRSLGKRPSIKGTKYARFPPRKDFEDKKAPWGVSKSAEAPMQMSGLKLSDSIEGLTPKEMMLLLKRRYGYTGESIVTQSTISDEIKDNKITSNKEYEEIEKGNHRRKLLFLSKLSEHALLSYELTGYIEQNSPIRRPPWRQMPRLPINTGGPIIVCLDTSGSMCGSRETLAKSVVLECSAQAAKYNRPFYVLAFSGYGNVAECDFPLGVQNKENLSRLLEFLSSSFDGGTDVTPPIRRAIELIETTEEWATADILLVSDGELMDPPLPTHVMTSLDKIKHEKQVQVHGLLIGADYSRPMNDICTHPDGVIRVYDFLSYYDDLTAAQMRIKKNKRDSYSNSNSNSNSYSSGMNSPPYASTLWATSPYMSSSSTSGARMSQKRGFYSIPSYTRNSMYGLYGSIYNHHSRSSSTFRQSMNQMNMINPLSQLVSHFSTKSKEKSFIIKITTTTTTTLQGNMNSDTTTDDLKSQIMKNFESTMNSFYHDIQISNQFYEIASPTTTTSVNTDTKNENQLDLMTIIRHSYKTLNEGLIERDTEVKLMLLAVLCREHILLLGPPGTGKSDLGRRLASIIQPTQAQYSFFERLLTKYSNPEELFGPLSLSSLEQDKYVRNTQGYLPTASIAFLDEIFKANSAILNSLLTILNERKFDNGNERLDVPLMAVVGASNELPDSEELDALYDRFLFRRQVSPISDDNIMELIKMNPFDTGDKDKEIPRYLKEELITNLINQASSDITVPTSVAILLRDTRKFLRDECNPPIYVSDRRLVKIIKLLQMMAVTQGRKEVTLLDCMILPHVLWYQPDEESKIRTYLIDYIDRYTFLGYDSIYGFFKKESEKILTYITDENLDTTNLAELITESKAALSVLSNTLIEGYCRIDMLIRECDVNSIPTTSDGTTTTNKGKDSKIDMKEALMNDILITTSIKRKHNNSNSGDSSSNQVDNSDNNIDYFPSPHFWLSTPDRMTIYQKLLPRQKSIINQVIGALETVAMSLKSLKYLEKKYNLTPSDTSYMLEGTNTDMEILSEDELNKIKQVLLDSSTSNDSSNDKNSSNNTRKFNDEELAYSKKVAQKKLSPDDFKLWKDTQKKLKRKSKHSDDDDDDYDDDE